MHSVVDLAHYKRSNTIRHAANLLYYIRHKAVHYSLRESNTNCELECRVETNGWTVDGQMDGTDCTTCLTDAVGKHVKRTK